MNRTVCAVTVMTAVTLPFAMGTAGAQEDLQRSGTFTVDLAFHWRGTDHQVGTDHIYWLGESRGVVLNRTGSGFFHKAALFCPGYADVKGEAVATGGFCVVTDADGDRVTIRYGGATETGAAGDSSAIDETGAAVTCLEGTGKYEGIKCQMAAEFGDIAIRSFGSKSQGEGLGQWTGEYQLP